MGAFFCRAGRGLVATPLGVLPSPRKTIIHPRGYESQGVSGMFNQIFTMARSPGKPSGPTTRTNSARRLLQGPPTSRQTRNPLDYSSGIPQLSTVARSRSWQRLRRLRMTPGRKPARKNTHAASGRPASIQIAMVLPIRVFMIIFTHLTSSSG